MDGYILELWSLSLQQISVRHPLIYLYNVYSITWTMFSKILFFKKVSIPLYNVISITSYIMYGFFVLLQSMEEYQTIRCSFENYCKKCSWIYINQPRISEITRITEHCLTTHRVQSKEVQVFYNGNRSTNRYYGERCCYGERTVFFIAGIIYQINHIW